MLLHDDIVGLLPYSGRSVVLDTISELDCLRRAEGHYYWPVPETTAEGRLAEARYVASEALLQAAGVAVFCYPPYQGKLMDVLRVYSATWGERFQRDVVSAESCQLMELGVAAEIREIGEQSGRAMGTVIYAGTSAYAADFSFWLLTPEQIKDADGTLPCPQA